MDPSKCTTISKCNWTLPLFIKGVLRILLTTVHANINTVHQGYINDGMRSVMNTRRLEYILINSKLSQSTIPLYKVSECILMNMSPI